MLRRDGFISLSAGKKGGEILTEPFKLSGRKLFVNVSALKGELRATVLGANGKVLATSVPVEGDHPRGVGADAKRTNEHGAPGIEIKSQELSMVSPQFCRKMLRRSVRRKKHKGALV